MLKDVYPEYQDSVDFYAVNIDLGEDLSSIVRFRDGQGYPWPVAQAPAGMLPEYNIVQQSTKVAIDGDGVIAFREGYGVAAGDTWLQVFQQLSGA